jgi:hypothetical protein
MKHESRQMLTTLFTSAERVQKEWDELSVRLGKLARFMNGPDFTALSVNEQVRLRTQQIFMREYAAVLRARLDSHFE